MFNFLGKVSAIFKLPFYIPTSSDIIRVQILAVFFFFYHCVTVFYFAFNLHTTNRKFHKTSVCVGMSFNDCSWVCEKYWNNCQMKNANWEKPAIRENSGVLWFLARWEWEKWFIPLSYGVCGLVHRMHGPLGMTSSSLTSSSHLPRLIVPSSSVFRKLTLSSLGDCAIFEGRHRVKPITVLPAPHQYVT